MSNKDESIKLETELGESSTGKKSRTFSLIFRLKSKGFSTKSLKKGFLFLSIIFLAAAIFLGGTYYGARRQIKSQSVDLTRYWQVYDLLKDKYVGNIDSSKLSQESVVGLVNGIGDPYTVYLPPADRKALDDDLKGSFEGIGAELTNKDNNIVVVAPLAGSPAEKAGLKPQDIIVKVDGKSVEGMTVDNVIDLIRGPKDSTVKLTIVRDGVDGLKDITITRDVILIKSVEWKMLANNVGYIEVKQFGDDTEALFKSAIDDIAGHNPKALVIDLRNDPGGYLNTVPTLAGYFIPPSVVVYEAGKNGQEDSLRTTSAPTLPNTPLYLLVNGGSASAAEIFAGALQDYKRATLIGKTTFGKGCVQDLIPFNDGAALKVTIAQWLTPNKRQISGVGLTPDVKVDADKTATTDPVLDKALELAK